jgi:hypothetical protein
MPGESSLRNGELSTVNGSPWKTFSSPIFQIFFSSVRLAGAPRTVSRELPVLWYAGTMDAEISKREDALEAEINIFKSIPWGPARP